MAVLDSPIPLKEAVMVLVKASITNPSIWICKYCVPAIRVCSSDAPIKRTIGFENMNPITEDTEDSTKVSSNA